MSCCHYPFCRRPELQLKNVDALSTLDTPQHTATLLSMLRFAQQLAVAEATQQQLLQAATATAAKDSVACQSTIASLQPHALVMLRVMRGAALAAEQQAQQQQQQQQQQQVPAAMLQQLLVLRTEYLYQQRHGRHFMFGPVSTCIQVRRIID
jgi:hypothetical protein